MKNSDIMRKIGVMIVSFVFVGGYLFVPLAIQAAPTNAGTINNGTKTDTSSINNGNKTNAGTMNDAKIKNPIQSVGSLSQFLVKILEIFKILAAMVVVFFIIYAGLQYVLARGDEGAIKKAHQTLLWTVVGAAILLGAEVISRVIEGTVKELAK